MDSCFNLILIMVFTFDPGTTYMMGNNCKSFINGKNMTCTCRNVNLTLVRNFCPNSTSALDLDGNNLPTLHNYSFAIFKDLRSLSLHKCNIKQIEALAFHNLSELEELDIGDNSLQNTSLPNKVFQSLTSLKLLNIGNNIFMDYPGEHFADLITLRTLIIQGFRSELPQEFSKLCNLEKLFLRPCMFSYLTNDTFINLMELPLHHIELNCQIYKVDTHAFHPLKSLVSLQMSGHNKIKISNLTSSLTVFKNRNMTSLDLDSSYNPKIHSFDKLSPEDGAVIGNICIAHLALGKNNIQKVQSGFFKTMQYKNCLESISFADNFIRGDFGVLLELSLLKNLLWLDLSGQIYTLNPHMLRNRRLEVFPSYVNDIPYSFEQFNTAILQAPPKLQFFNFSHIGLKFTPFNWNITIINGENLKVLDMSYLNYISCRGNITGLPNLQVFNFSKSNCSDLSLVFFHGFPNLKHLTFQSAELSFVIQIEKYKELLYSMQRLQDIDLSKNQLKHLTSNLLFMQKNVLKRLVLDDNLFDDIPLSVSEFPKINVVSLKHNKIESLSEESRREIDKAVSLGYNFTLYLENNPLKCNCESFHFIEWLFTTYAVFDKDKDYPCLFTDGTTKTTLWVYHRRKRVQIACISDTLLSVVLDLTILLVISISVVSIIYKYRVPITFWYYNVRRKYRILKDMDKTMNYKYDAFIAYHHLDGSFVKAKIMDYLERQKGLKVCVHQRDFISGNYIGDNIMAAIKESRKVVILLTMRYLKSKWGMFELDMARMQMFQDDRNLLIILLLEDLKPADMPASLQYIWQRITCIEPDNNLYRNVDPSDDQLIWRKLYQSIES